MEYKAFENQNKNLKYLCNMVSKILDLEIVSEIFYYYPHYIAAQNFNTEINFLKKQSIIIKKYLLILND